MPPPKKIGSSEGKTVHQTKHLSRISFQMMLAAAEPIGVSPNLDPGSSQLFCLGSTVGHP